MKILFDCFKYTDEYYQKIETGIVNKDDTYNLEKDAYREKILIETKSIKCARPTEQGQYTEISLHGDDYFYLIDMPFADYLQIQPHSKYAQLKSKWAN